MKNLKKLTILVIALVCFVPSVVFAKDKVNVYMFRGEGCGYCARAIAYFRELIKDDDYKDKFDLVTYEVWNDENNSKLMAAVADELDETVNGVPFIVIGDTAFGGYSSSYNEDIEKAIDDSYSDKKYKDVVADVISKNDYKDKVTITKLDDIKETTTESASTTSKTDSNAKDEKSNTGIIIGVVCIVLGGLGALIYVSRS